MSADGDGPLEIVMAGFILIVLGTALAPLLPFNVAAIGWVVLLLGVVAAFAVLAAAILSAIESI